MLPNSSSSQRSHGTVCTRSKSHFLVRIRPRQSRPLTRVRARDPLPPRYSGNFDFVQSVTQHVERNAGDPFRVGAGVLRGAAPVIIALLIQYSVNRRVQDTSCCFPKIWPYSQEMTESLRCAHMDHGTGRADGNILALM